MIPIEKEIREIEKNVIYMRRQLHQIPEAGFKEYKTSAFIEDQLKKYGLKVFTGIAKTGVVAYLNGSIGKHTIAFRADMDALTVEEKTDLLYQSQHKGMMHACGHDAHMAILLGLAKYLAAHRDKVQDNIVFLFQPAEEGPGGAQSMIKEGVIQKFQIDKIFGLHVFPEIEEGKIGCRPGAFMAQSGEFDIVIRGQSGHGAVPQKSKDAILIAAELVSIYQSIISRSIDPTEGAVLTIGKMWAGERRNIIAGEACLEGTIRAFEAAIYNQIKKRMIEIAKGLEIMHRCVIKIVFRDMYPTVMNDVELFQLLIEAAGEENIIVTDPQMMAEDFSYFQRDVPGLFFFLGVRNEQKNYIYPLHHCQFNFNEEVLLTGIQIYVNLLRHIKSFRGIE